MCIFLLSSGLFYMYQLYVVNVMLYSDFQVIYSHRFSICSITYHKRLFKSAILNEYKIVAVSVIPLHSLFVPLFQGSLFRCIYIHAYIFQPDVWILYLYEMFLFGSSNVSYLKLYLVLNCQSYFRSFKITIFSCPFTFNLFMYQCLPQSSISLILLFMQLYKLHLSTGSFNSFTFNIIINVAEFCSSYSV